MFWSLVRPDRILPPITRSAAVTASLEAGASAVVMITCRRTHQTMDRRKTVKHASSSSALTLPLWVMPLQVTVEENWKRDFAQLYVTRSEEHTSELQSLTNLV